MAHAEEEYTVVQTEDAEWVLPVIQDCEGQPSSPTSEPVVQDCASQPSSPTSESQDLDWRNESEDLLQLALQHLEDASRASHDDDQDEDLCGESDAASAGAIAQEPAAAAVMEMAEAEAPKMTGDHPERQQKQRAQRSSQPEAEAEAIPEGGVVVPGASALALAAGEPAAPVSLSNAEHKECTAPLFKATDAATGSGIDEPASAGRSTKLLSRITAALKLPPCSGSVSEGALVLLQAGLMAALLCLCVLSLTGAGAASPHAGPVRPAAVSTGLSAGAGSLEGRHPPNSNQQAQEQEQLQARSRPVRLESRKHRYAETALEGEILSAKIQTVHSAARPTAANWGHTGRTLWVDQGLRATFEVMILETQQPTELQQARVWGQLRFLSEAVQELQAQVNTHQQQISEVRPLPPASAEDTAARCTQQQPPPPDPPQQAEAAQVLGLVRKLKHQLAERDAEVAALKERLARRGGQLAGQLAELQEGLSAKEVALEESKAALEESKAALKESEAALKDSERLRQEAEQRVDEKESVLLDVEQQLHQASLGADKLAESCQGQGMPEHTEPAYPRLKAKLQEKSDKISQLRSEAARCSEERERLQESLNEQSAQASELRDLVQVLLSSTADVAELLKEPRQLAARQGQRLRRQLREAGKLVKGTVGRMAETVEEMWRTATGDASEQNHGKPSCGQHRDRAKQHKKCKKH